MTVWSVLPSVVSFTNSFPGLDVLIDFSMTQHYNRIPSHVVCLEFYILSANPKNEIFQETLKRYKIFTN